MIDYTTPTAMTSYLVGEITYSHSADDVMVLLFYVMVIYLEGIQASITNH